MRMRSYELTPHMVQASSLQEEAGFGVLCAQMMVAGGTPAIVIALDPTSNSVADARARGLLGWMIGVDRNIVEATDETEGAEAPRTDRVQTERGPAIRFLWHDQVSGGTYELQLTSLSAARPEAIPPRVDTPAEVTLPAVVESPALPLDVQSEPTAVPSPQAEAPAEGGNDGNAT